MPLLCNAGASGAPRWVACGVDERARMVTQTLARLFRRAYAPLVEAGYVEVVYGGAKEGQFLCTHALVKSIHLTGSAATYDAVVWGEQQAEGKQPGSDCPPKPGEVGSLLKVAQQL